MKIFKFIASILLFSSLAVGQISIVQQWDFNDKADGTGNLNSDNGLNFQFIGTPVVDTILNDGAYTVTRGDGYSGDRPLGATFTSGIITMEATISAFNFSNGNEQQFGMQLRSGGATVATLNFDAQPAGTANNGNPFPDRMRLTGTGTGGVVLNATTSNTPITYGLTLDLDANTYTYWVGTPDSDNSTWVSRYNGHTGSITADPIDAIRWSIQDYSTGNSFTLDQVRIYTGAAAVPESSTMALLLGLSALGFVAIRRKVS